MTLESFPIAGIALALASAAALAVGNLYQAKGVHGLGDSAAQKLMAKVGRLIRSRWWMLGGLFLFFSIVLQMASLTFAPLIVVQPVGVTALVFTVLVTAIVTRKRPSKRVVVSIAICVVGVAAFVTVAATHSTQPAITSAQLWAILIVLASVIIVAAAFLFVGRKRHTKPIVWVFLGGIFSAFVATLGKTVILRVEAVWKARSFELDVANLLTIGCLVGIAIAGALSVYFVQKAHVDNRPDVVVAGLTVIDPAVAVILGITILAEASTAPLWVFVAFVIAGGVAVYGVFALSKAESVPDDEVGVESEAAQGGTNASRP